MGIRYNGKSTITNSDKLYEEALKKRGLKKIVQFGTQTLPYPTASQISRMQLVQHVWATGDRFYKLASKHYGDPTLWWVIAWFNQTPTESHVKQGDVIQIALNIEELVDILGL